MTDLKKMSALQSRIESPHHLAIAFLLLGCMQGCKWVRQPAKTSNTVASTQTPAATPAATQPEHVAEPAPWMLSYAGKDPNELAEDKRFRPFLRTHVSNKPLRYWTDEAGPPSLDAEGMMSGPGDDIQKFDNRYVVAAACPPHDCTDNGLLWVDTASGFTVFAASLITHPAPPKGYGAHLWLFTNSPLTEKNFPPTLLTAIANWTQQSGNPDEDTVINGVTVVEPDGTQLAMTPAEAHAWAPGMPTKNLQGER